MCVRIFLVFDFRWTIFEFCWVTVFFFFGGFMGRWFWFVFAFVNILVNFGGCELLLFTRVNWFCFLGYFLDWNTLFFPVFFPPESVLLLPRICISFRNIIFREYYHDWQDQYLHHCIRIWHLSSFLPCLLSYRNPLWKTAPVRPLPPIHSITPNPTLPPGNATPEMANREIQLNTELGAGSLNLSIPGALSLSGVWRPRGFQG